MSRITCLIIFSGSSALSIKSFRLARTSVETLSNSAITTPSSLSVEALRLRRPWPLTHCVPAIANTDRNRQSDPSAERNPHTHVMGGGAHGSADAGSDPQPESDQVL